MKKRLFCLLFAAALLVGAALPASAAASGELKGTASYVYATVKAPEVASVGGEWAVLGLARSGFEVPEAYYQDYYARVEAYVKDAKGVLHARKYTEYSRVIVALAAIGKDARDVAGYDLTKPLGDYEKTIWQGVNGPIWALIALDAAGYPMPQNPEAKTQATRQMYIDRILSCQCSDGGWSLSGASDPDVTGMALQALAKYRAQPAVEQAIQEALSCMSGKQSADGGFSTGGTGTAESVAQMVTALCELGIPLDDARFVKNGHTLSDALLSYRLPDGSFRHLPDSAVSDPMASEQGLYALAAAQRAEKGQSSLYRMGDALWLSAGLPEKQPDVTRAPVTAAGTTFSDISGHESRTAVEALASRGIINGMGDGSFSPDANMNRAQFAAITVRALGLTAKANDAFSDVTADKWYAPYIGTAYISGVINGVGDGRFNPEGTITRQEAATMTARAAKLCGLDTAYDAPRARAALAHFTDSAQVADWALAPLAFCFDNGILDASAAEIRPATPIRRGEIAQMLYNLLDSAALL